MRFVLDSNEYIFAFGISKETTILALFEQFRSHPTRYSIHVCRSIINEVYRNTSESEFQDFFDFISKITSIDEDYTVPFELGAKYENLGLKPGDAFIAAYADYFKAEFLVSENRHFLSRRSDMPFRVVSASDCLKSLKS